MAKKTELGLGENVEGALSYILGWITGIVFLVLEGKNDFVRFHATQSIITFLPLTILGFIFGTIGGVGGIGGVFYWTFSPLALIFTILSWLIGLVTFLLWLVLMAKAYQGERYKLPIVGDIAEGQV